MPEIQSTFLKATIQGNKLQYLEGIRGAAAFMVVIHHYLLAFYPAQASGDPKTAHFAALELLYYKSPFTFLTCGHFFVFIFFVLSGYVLSRKSFKEDNNNYLTSAFIRRLPRLYIPMAFSLIVAFILIKLSLNFNTDASLITKSVWFAGINQGSPSVFIFVKSLVYKAMFFEDNSYIIVLWTIYYELFGSVMVFALLALTYNIRGAYWIYLVLFILLLIGHHPEYGAFVLGIFLNYTEKITIKYTKYKKFILIGILIAGFLIGGFPDVYALTTPTLKGTFYEFLNYSFIIKRGALLNSIGAFLVIFAAQQSLLIKKLFSSKFLIFLGSVSFSLYLIHIAVLQSFSSFLFIKTEAALGYNMSFLLTFVCSILLVGVVSYFMTIYVDKASVSYSKSFYKKYFAKG